AAARDAWDIVHVNTATGMSLAGWLDDIWSNIMNHIDPKKKAGWIGEIESPPKGVDAAVDFDAEERAFLNAMKAVAREEKRTKAVRWCHGPGQGNPRG